MALGLLLKVSCLCLLFAADSCFPADGSNADEEENSVLPEHDDANTTSLILSSILADLSDDDSPTGNQSESDRGMELLPTPEPDGDSDSLSSAGFASARSLGDSEKLADVSTPLGQSSGEPSDPWYRRLYEWLVRGGYIPHGESGYGHRGYGFAGRGPGHRRYYEHQPYGQWGDGYPDYEYSGYDQWSGVYPDYAYPGQNQWQQGYPRYGSWAGGHLGYGYPDYAPGETGRSNFGEPGTLSSQSSHPTRGELSGSGLGTLPISEPGTTGYGHKGAHQDENKPGKELTVPPSHGESGRGANVWQGGHQGESVHSTHHDYGGHFGHGGTVHDRHFGHGIYHDYESRASPFGHHGPSDRGVYWGSYSGRYPGHRGSGFHQAGSDSFHFPARITSELMFLRNDLNRLRQMPLIDAWRTKEVPVDLDPKQAVNPLSYTVNANGGFLRERDALSDSKYKTPPNDPEKEQNVGTQTKNY